MSARAWRAEDLTSGKTGDKDAVLITRLAAQLRCYLPEPADETWARLRHLVVRRARLVAESASQVQQMLTCSSAPGPRYSTPPGSRSSPTTCRAALTVALSRAGGDLGMARLGLRCPGAAVRRQVAR